MISNICIIFINIFFILYINHKKNYDNKYEKEKDFFYKRKIKAILTITNIIYIILNVCNLITCYYKKSIDTIDIITFSIFFLSFILVELTNTKYNFKILNKKILNKYDILIILSLASLICGEKISKNEIFFFLGILFIVIGILLIAYKYIKYKEYVVLNIKQEDYLEDIKFSNKLELNKIFNYVIYITAFIVFIYINIPYIFILYIIVDLILILVAYKKAKKIENESFRIYRSITIANEYPGIIYAFQFTRDLLFLKKICITILCYTTSIIMLYMVGESTFSIISLQLYLLLLYTAISDKIYLIRYTKSLNEEFIDKKKYNINVIKNITYIDNIKILNIKIYRLIIVDNVLYKSNLILYDPELVIKDIKLRINKSNINDYITMENILYEE